MLVIANGKGWEYVLEEFDDKENFTQLLEYLVENGLKLSEIPKTFTAFYYDYINDKEVEIEIETASLLTRILKD